MTVPLSIALPLALSLAFAGTFVANEWSRGGLADAAGLGHHHMLDWDDAHCHAPDGDDPRHQLDDEEDGRDPSEPCMGAGAPVQTSHHAGGVGP